MDDKENKICKKCNILQSVDNFPIDYSGSKKNRISTCKSCTKKYQKQYLVDNKDRMSELGRKYRRKNKEHYAIIKKEWRAKNKDKVKKYNDNYRKNYPEKIKFKSKKYFQDHKKEINQSYTLRRSTDIQFKISHSLRGKLFNSIKKESKRSSALLLLGCSVKEFKKYIEKQFKPGMSWDKWGNGKDKFHLDHIVPIAAFDLTDYEQQKICFHYTNFRPAWSHENWSKSDWIEWDGKHIRGRNLKGLKNEN